jgi:tRNA(fMet)-specific endonuclease VapC
VGEALILETAFLINLEREQRRGLAGRAVAFFESNQDARYYVTTTTAGELAAGVSMADREAWETFLAPLFLLAPNPDVSWEYGRIYRHLQKNRQLIGANDLWIAATALAYRMPVVTDNVAHYQRVPGLDVRRY